MNESFREHRPLLYDDSDDEKFSHRPGKQYRVTTLRGGINYKVKGAAAIISRWPDHWSSVLYWWILLGMIVITVMVICNIMLTFAFVPSSYSFNEQTSIARTTKETLHSGQSNNVYMHVFINNNEKQDLNKYLPYLNRITDDFSEFKFNFVVVINDVMAHHNTLMQNNDITMTHLKPNIRDRRAAINHLKNIDVQQIFLTKYLDSSPLEKYWRGLSQNLIPFLVRIISIWEKGGIAFDPTVTQLSNANYYNNIVKVLSKHRSKLIPQFEIEKKLQQNKQVNNIQDIIKSLDKENHVDETLEEAENRQISQRDTEKRKIDRDVEVLSSINRSLQNYESSTISKRNLKLVGDNDINHFKDLEFLQIPADLQQSNDSDVILTIDIYGNIIETNVQCHAFIGQIFTDVAHHLQNNVTDFIMKELSLFCKGKLPPCNGIEVITL